MRLSEITQNNKGKGMRLSDVKSSYGITEEYERDKDFPEPERRRELIKNFGVLEAPKESTLEKVADVAVPIGGAVLAAGAGTALLPEVGVAGLIALGAGAGKMITESIKELGRPDRTILESTADVLGEGIKETVGTYILGSAGEKTGGAIRKAFPYSRIAKYIAGFLGNIPEEAKAETIAYTSQVVQKDLGVPRIITEIAINNPEKVFTSKNLDIKKISPLSESTINSMKGVARQAFETTKKQYEYIVQPILKANDTPIGILDIYDDFLKNATRIAKFKKGKLVPSARIDKEASRTLNDFYADLQKLGENATPEKLHKFKQYINQVLERKVAKDNPALQGILQDVHKAVRNKIESVIPRSGSIPGYKDITDEYAFLFEAESDIGSLLKSKNVESLVNKYLTDKNEGFRLLVDQFLSKDAKAREIFQNAIYEQAGFAFSNQAGQAIRPSISEIGERGIRALQRRSEIPIKRVKKLKNLKKKLDKTPLRTKLFRAGTVTAPQTISNQLFGEIGIGDNE